MIYALCFILGMVVGFVAALFWIAGKFWEN